MDAILKFLINVGELKDRERRGWLANKVPNCETTASHIFRVSLMAWVLARKKKLNIDKVIKMALIHDICEVFTTDETPYDPFLPANFDSLTNQQKTEEILKKWPKLSLAQKKKRADLKHKREEKSLLKLLTGVDESFKNEIIGLWQDYEKGLSKEGRFTKQVDKAENFLQGMEYWQKHGKIQRDLWIRWAKEIFDDPIIIDFIKTIEKEIVVKKK
ncbi:MAG: HD domain-containing protein [Candidatus Pacebacteria bacterium]|nr:HD domain-containing protein [Candidatus Paceibacterota bacterium]